MEKLQALLTAFRGLGVRSASMSENLIHIETTTDDQLKLIARQLVVTPQSGARGGVHWLTAHARFDGVTVLVLGPEHRMQGAA